MADNELGDESHAEDPSPTSETISYKSLPRVGFRPMTAHRTTMLPTPPPSLPSQQKGPQDTHTSNSAAVESRRTSTAKHEQNPGVRLLKQKIENIQRDRKEREDSKRQQEPDRDEVGNDTGEGNAQTHADGVVKSNTMKQEKTREEAGQGQQLDKGGLFLKDGTRDDNWKPLADYPSRKAVKFGEEAKSKRPTEIGAQGKVGIGETPARRHGKARDDNDSGYCGSTTTSLVNRSKINNPLPSRPQFPFEAEKSGPDVPLSLVRRSAAVASSNPRPMPSEHLSEDEKPSNESSRPQYYGITQPTSPIVVDAVYASAGTKDHTVHLELDLLVDLDEELEEFNRLVRMGSFATAKSFFDLHLKAHVSDPYVFVQYAEMLLEKGDFKSLSLIDGRPVFGRGDSSGDIHADFGSKRRLELNWKLIRATALCCSQHKLHSVWKGLDHLPLRILLLTMRLTRLVAAPAVLADFARRQLNDWADWKRLYRQLLSEDRIWDFRDVFLAISACYGTEDALQAFYGYDSSMNSLLVDWQTDPHDESTNMALLDILSLTALATGTYTGVHYLAETCVQLAESIGNSQLDTSPYVIHSRPFLRWVVAKAVVNSGSRNFKYFLDYPGLTVFPRIEGMPYYIPVSQENPGWLPLDPTPTTRESLLMALKSSRVIQDYKTEALCLRELAFRTQDPGELIQELGQLQRFRQHNMDGYLVTLLSRYLICRDYSSRSELLKDIESFDVWQDPSDLVNPTGLAARAVLRHALSQDSEINAGQSLGSALRYYKYLPKPLQTVIDCHYPAPPSTLGYDGHRSRPWVMGKRSQRGKSSEKERKERTVPKSKRVMDNIEDQQTHDHSAQSRNDNQTGGREPPHRSDDINPRIYGDQNSQTLTKREDRSVIKTTSWYSDSYTNSEDLIDPSVAESSDWDTKSASDGAKATLNVDVEHAEESPGQAIEKHSRPRSHSRDDSLPQSDTEPPLVGTSTTPHDSATGSSGNMNTELKRAFSAADRETGKGREESNKRLQLE